MALYYLFSMGILGTVIGSFLNVVIYRMHTGRSINGRSHCMTCGAYLKWYDLLPLVSYVSLRGKCRNCRAHIPSRYFIIELITGLTFILLWLHFQNNLLLFALNAIFFSVLIVLTVYDLRHLIIPDELTILLLATSIIYVVYEYSAFTSWKLPLTQVLAALAGAGFYAALWYVSRGRWIGFGDAKLAVPLGIVVGAGGVFSLVVLSFWIGSIISVAILLIQKLLKQGKTRLLFHGGPLTMKSEVPFAPFLILAFTAVHLFHADIFTIIGYFTALFR